MAHDDIPEDRDASYPCPKCDGEIKEFNFVWSCDKCGFDPVKEQEKEMIYP